MRGIFFCKISQKAKQLKNRKPLFTSLYYLLYHLPCKCFQFLFKIGWLKRLLKMIENDIAEMDLKINKINQ
jgi:hypothetical protein